MTLEFGNDLGSKPEEVKTMSTDLRNLVAAHTDCDILAIKFL